MSKLYVLNRVNQQINDGVTVEVFAAVAVSESRETIEAAAQEMNSRRSPEEIAGLVRYELAFEQVRVI